MNKNDLICENNFLFDSAANSIVAYVGMDSDLIIPQTIGGKEVKNLGEDLFKYNEGLKSVTIPNGVRNRALRF